MDLGQEREPNLGRVLDGHLVIGLLGAGGFGRVYRALALAPHDYEGDEVALKIASPAGGQHDALAAERLGREARALGRLDHPNVVRLLGSGVADGAPYLVMELIADGVSLEDEIAARAARAEPFAPGEVRQILGQILDGLGAAHALGIVHRDVKPENVMLVPPAPGESGPQVRLLDFGLVKFRVKPGRQVGSARSAAAGGAEEEADMGATRAERGHHHRGAEKTRSLALDADPHGAGADRRPRHRPLDRPLRGGRHRLRARDRRPALRRQHRLGGPARARRPGLRRAGARPGAAGRLHRALTRALARDPAERYRSASAMRAALDEAMAEWLGPMATPRSRPRMPTRSARPPSSSSPTRRRPRRRRGFPTCGSARCCRPRPCCS
ncbi:MAG: serine/threonine-protein kinase [Myxococcota bacterium]